MPKIPFNTDLPLILLEVVVEKKDIRNVIMALDTGCSRTIVSYETAVAIGADPAISPKRTRIVTGSGIEISPLVTVSKIKTLGKEIKNLEVACHTLPEEGFVDGLLGLDFLKNFNLFVNFKKGIVELSDEK